MRLHYEDHQVNAVWGNNCCWRWVSYKIVYLHSVTALPKFSEFAARTENDKSYSFVPLGAVVFVIVSVK